MSTKVTHTIIILSFFTLCSGFTYITPKPTTRNKIYNGYKNDKLFPLVNPNGYRNDKPSRLVNPPSRKSTSLSSSAALIAKSGLDLEAGFYMLLLALQFGTQPALTKKFTPKGINRSTVVMAQVSHPPLTTTTKQQHRK